MKRKIMLSLTLLMALFVKSWAQQNEAIHVESRSDSDPNITYIVDIVFDQSNNATITRTTRTFVFGDVTSGIFQLNQNEYTIDEVASTVTISTSGEQKFIYEIEENEVHTTVSGGPPLVLHAWCQSYAPCLENQECRISWMVSDNRLSAVCVGGCARCVLKAEGSGGGIGPPRNPGSGFIVFKAVGIN
jgi:hypothetical protein